MTMEPLRNYSVPRSVLMLIVAEMMNATPHVLQNVLTGGVLHFGWTTTKELYLKDLIEFPTFLMALTVSGFIRNGVCESMCSGVYGYGFRYKLTEALSRGIQTDIVQTLMAATKEMYGIVCLTGVFILLLMLLYDVQPIRRAMFHMPSNLALLRRFRKTIE